MAETGPRVRVRDLAQTAERLRRGRLVDRQLARLVPALGAVLVVFTVISRVAGWRPIVPIAVVAIAVAGVALVAWLGRRVPAISDAMAMRIDDDAAQQGELRSAHWFAGQDAADEWTDYHLEKAADRLDRVEWRSVYPPVRAGWSWAAGAALAVIAVAGAIRFAPPVAGKGANTIADGSITGEAASVVLPPELRKKLEDLLNSMSGKDLSPEDAARLAKMKDLLMKLDPTQDPKLADLLNKIKQNEDKAQPADKATAAGDPDSGADADPTKPSDLHAALADLAEKLANSQAQKDQKAQGGPAAKTEDANKASGQASEMGGDMSIKLTREAATDAGRGDMMQGGGAMGGDARSGSGGNRGQGPGRGTPLALAEALRKEFIEANQDTKGANVMTEDIRRKTEQGTSTLGFSHVAPRTTFDPSRALPPPPVPAARRLVVEQYFIRR